MHCPIIVNISFEVSNDHLTSQHDHTCQPFCSLRCLEGTNTKHLFTLFFCLEIKDASNSKQVQQMTKGAKCSRSVRWLLLRYILHSWPNLPNNITSISPEDRPLTIHSRENIPKSRARHMKLNDFEEFQS